MCVCVVLNVPFYKILLRWERLVDRAESVLLEPNMVGSKAASKACNMFNCFDVYRSVLT